MKRCILLLFVFMLVGCGSAVTPSKQVTQTPASTPTQQVASTGGDVRMEIGQTGELDGWRVTLKSVRVDIDYQIVNDRLNADENHHYVFTNMYNTPERAPLVVCHVLITNIGAQDDYVSATSDSSRFWLISLPYRDGDTGQPTFTPYIQANKIDAHVPVGSSIEGDVVSAGGHGEYLFVFDLDATTGFGLKWQFSV